MAALGAFRHANAMPELGVVKLGWTPNGGQWCAALETSNEVSAEGLVQLFVERVKDMGERPEYTWSNAVKSAQAVDLRREAQHALEAASAETMPLAVGAHGFGTPVRASKAASRVRGIKPLLRVPPTKTLLAEMTRL